MTQRTAPTAHAQYIGSTTEELAAKRRGDRIAAGVDQKVLFPRRGVITLFPDRLVKLDLTNRVQIALLVRDAE